MMRFIRLALECVFVFLSFLLIGGAGENVIVSNTEEIKDGSNAVLGVIRYHYDSSMASCSSVLVLGVGTFMSVTDYDKVSEQIALGKPIVVVVADHNMDQLKKTSSTKFAHLINEFQEHIGDLIQICAEGHADIVIGGHSASGEASLGAWQLGLLEMEPIGFVGLDPYEISENTIDMEMQLDLPALFWGFTRTTCLVAKEKAAEAAYGLTAEKARVMYVIHNEDGCRITHCVFTDHGCGVRPLICSTEDTFDWVYQYVAKSIHLFLDAVQNNSAFSKEHFELHDVPEEVTLYVNHDVVAPSNLRNNGLGSSSVAEVMAYNA
jgi:hypothetical protein